MKEKNLPMTGQPTQEEKELTDYLLGHLANYVQQVPTERRTLIATLSRACQIVFCKQTHFDVKQQCEEIDAFCNFLKSFAMRNATRS